MLVEMMVFVPGVGAKEVGVDSLAVRHVIPGEGGGWVDLEMAEARRVTVAGKVPQVIALLNEARAKMARAPLVDLEEPCRGMWRSDREETAQRPVLDLDHPGSDPIGGASSAGGAMEVARSYGVSRGLKPQSAVGSGGMWLIRWERPSGERSEKAGMPDRWQATLTTGFHWHLKRDGLAIMYLSPLGAFTSNEVETLVAEIVSLLNGRKPEEAG